jgi:hypothetical protein
MTHMASRTTIQLQLDNEVASLLHARAAEANVSEDEIVERALRAFDLRALVNEIRRRSDLDEDAAAALVAEELKAARAERGRAA